MAWELKKEYYDGNDAFNVEDVKYWPEKPTKDEVLRAVEEDGYILECPNELFSFGDSAANGIPGRYEPWGNVHFTLFNYETWE